MNSPLDYVKDDFTKNWYQRRYKNYIIKNYKVFT